MPSAPESSDYLMVRRAARVLVGWLIAIALLNVLVPQIEEVVADDSTPMVPASAPSVAAMEEMEQTFGTGDSASFVLVVLERPSGLTPRDIRWARSLPDLLRQRGEQITFVQDIGTNEDLLRALTSTDGAALHFQVGIPGQTGAPTANRQIEAIREVLDAADAPTGLHHAVTGPAATVTDTSVAVERSLIPITVATVVMIATILFLLYRSLLVMGIILGTVGASLLAARAVVAGLGSTNWLPVSTFTGSFLTVVVLGAATDYSVFLVSRYLEERRRGLAHIAAVRRATGRIGSVIIGSAVTVVVANACMLLADIGFFRTTGPAVAVAVAVTLLISLTLLPAVITLVGRSGRLDPAETAERGATRWARIAAAVVARPQRVLAGALVPLIGLALLFPLMVPSLDQRSVQPDDTDSNHGYRLLSAHYPVNEALPNFVMVRSEKSLVTAKRLAALEHLAATLAADPGTVAVRGLTRPLGEPLTDASIGTIAGAVGDELGKAGERLDAGAADRLTDGIEELDSGAVSLSSGTRELARGAAAAVDGAGRLADSVDQLSRGVGDLTAGAGAAARGAGELRAGMRALADGLRVAADQTGVAVDGLGQALRGLDASPGCSLAPICRQARTGVRQVYEAQRDQLLPGLKEAATAARRLATGSVDLADGLRDLHQGLRAAQAGSTELRSAQRMFADRLDDLSSGATRLADGSAKMAAGTRDLAAGTDTMAASLAELEVGLSAAAKQLRQARRVALDPTIGGFYLPPAALDDERFASAVQLFLSPDHRTARLTVLPAADAFSTEASRAAANLLPTARAALAGTALRDAQVSTTGLAVLNGDLLHHERADFRLVATVALIAVLLILVLLLRSLVGPVVLLASVLVSYFSAMGLSVLVWQVLLGTQLDWTVGTMTFILLVAVGADYNLLLVKRIHEEAPSGDAAGIARATAVTGRVITSAGLIFAASMFALMAGSVTTLAQIGFTIGTGLLLDTFVVRSLVVPAAATLLGPRLWWPARPPAPA